MLASPHARQADIPLTPQLARLMGSSHYVSINVTITAAITLRLNCRNAAVVPSAYFLALDMTQLAQQIGQKLPSVYLEIGASATL